VFNRIQNLFPPVPSVEPQPANDPGDSPTSCLCGGQLVLFIDPAGKDKPEMLSVNCDRFTIDPGHTGSN
jgi:hypothetical protein